MCPLAVDRATVKSLYAFVSFFLFFYDSILRFVFFFFFNDSSLSRGQRAETVCEAPRNAPVKPRVAGLESLTDTYQGRLFTPRFEALIRLF